MLEHIASLKQHVKALQDGLLNGGTLAPWLDGLTAERYVRRIAVHDVT